MRISRTRQLHINMDNYEFVDLKAHVEIDTEVDYDQKLLAKHGVTQHEDVYEFLDEQLDLALSEDVHTAHIETGDEDSFIHLHHKEKIRSKK